MEHDKFIMIVEIDPEKIKETIKRIRSNISVKTAKITIEVADEILAEKVDLIITVAGGKEVMEHDFVIRNDVAGLIRVKTVSKVIYVRSNQRKY